MLMSKPAKPTHATNISALPLVPALRFPEFRNAPEWGKYRLDKVATFYNGRAYAQDELLEEGKYKVLRVGNFFTNNNWYYSDLELEETKYCDTGDLLYAWSASFGPRIWQGGKVIYHYHIWRVDNKDGTHKGFLYNVLASETERIKASSANGLGLMHVTKGAIESRECYFPEWDEQQKIADCLSSLDELIVAEASKVEALKAHKKGLTQQLFPAQGQTIPALRFPEFRNAGAWHEDTLGNVCEVLNNRRQPVSSDKRTSGEYPYYGASGIVDYINDYIFDERLLLVGEDGAKWGAFEKTAFTAEGKYWVNNHAHVLRPISVVDALLENYLTMIDMAPYVTGAAPPKLTLGKLKEIPVPIPPLPKEQQKIADCLSSLDELITAQASKVEALRAHKKGLMQQLFPSLADAVGE